MARETIARQSNEDEVTAVFRLYILRFWSRERIENFCLHLLGVDVHEYRAWRQAVEQSVQSIGGEAAAKSWCLPAGTKLPKVRFAKPTNG